tara:strand:- start:214 stop:510 length:297 start_codon:yes stop_codon:yes gene_type:complete
MKYLNDKLSLDEGSFVMNHHNGLLRFGVITRKAIGPDRWARYEVQFFEDEVHEHNVDFRSKLCGEDRRHHVYRGDELSPVNPEWLRNVVTSFEENQNG